jgi:tetratricopeptide (TPR) repeat protein
MILGMPEPTTIIGLCLTKGFVAGIIGNLVASVFYDTGKGAVADIGRLVAGDLQQGQLPANHDLSKLAERSLRSALLFAQASCAYTIGEKQPFLPAMMTAWREKRLFDQPLIHVRDTPQHAWLQRFGDAIKDDSAFKAFDGDGAGLDEFNATKLTASELDAKMQQLVRERLSDWVDRHVESPAPAVARQVCLVDGLANGFPIDGDLKRRLTVYAAWCLFFREGLKDDNDERPFKAFVIAKLNEISSREGTTFNTEALANDLSTKVIAKLGETIPNVQYFDDQFKKISEDLDELKQGVKTLVDRVKPQIAIPRLPQLQNPFVGRDDEIKALLAQFHANNNTAGVAGLRGQGGIGKTALALHVGQSLVPGFPDGQVYIDLRGTTDPLSPRVAMESILRQFDPLANFKEPSDAQLADFYRNALGGRRVLLLLDNAGDARQVAALIPGGSCGVIVTSRKQFKVGGLDPLKLDLLSEADAIALAQATAPRLTSDEARALSVACGRLALAVRVAATQINNYGGIPVTQHIADLTSDRLKYLDEVEHDDPDGLPFARRAIELSLERLPNEVRTFWARLSVFPVDFNSVLASFVAFDSDEPDVNQGQRMLEDLRRSALLEFDETKRRYSFHDLAREYAWKRGLPDDDARTDLSRRHAVVFMQMLSAADQLYLEGKPSEGLAMLDAELASVVAGQKWAADHSQSDPAACHLAARYYDAGVYVLNLRLSSMIQIAWLTAAVDACHKLGDRRGEGSALGNLGLAHAALGDARTANGYYEQRLVIAREIGDRRGEGNALGNLGLAHADLGDARTAIGYYEQQLTITREIGDRRGEGNALGNLGLAHADLGDAPTAIGYYEQQLTISREIGDRRGEGNAMGNLGNAHARLGDARTAIGYYEQQLTITREIDDRRGEGNAIFNRALLLAGEGRWAEAAADMGHTAGIYAAIEHPSAARAAELAGEYRQKGGG